MSGSPYVLYQQESYLTGINGAIYIVHRTSSATLVYGRHDRWEIAMLPERSKLIVQELEDKQVTGTSYATLNDAKVAAFKLLLDDTHATSVDSSMPVAWIVFTQTIYVAMLFLPGVTFVGSLYAVIAHVAVLLSAVMSNAPYLMTASRVSTAVAIGNMLLSILVWQSALGTLAKVGAAYRAAIVTATAFCIISTNQYLSQLAESPPPSAAGAAK